MFDDYRGIPKQAQYLIYATIFPSLAYGMFYTDISYYLTTVQKIPDVAMGIVISLMGVSAVISSITLGIAADRFGKRRFLIFGNILASLIIGVFAVATNIYLLYAAALVEGVSEGAFAASTNALLADKAGDMRRNSAFSLSGFVGGLAFGAGSFMIAMVAVFSSFGLSDRASHTTLYLILAFLSLGSTLIMLKITEPPLQKQPKVVISKPPPSKSRRARIKYRAGRAKARINELLPKKSRWVLVKFLLTSAIIAFGAGLIVPLMLRWLKVRYGLPDAIGGPILGVANIVIGVATLAAPPLARRIGCVNAIVLTQTLSTVFMFATPLSPDYVSASFVHTLRAFLMNMANPLQQSMIMGLVPQEERGAASGISAALWRLPNALSTVIGAYLIGIGQLATPFFLAGVFYVVSLALFYYYFRNVTLPEEADRKTNRLNQE